MKQPKNIFAIIGSAGKRSANLKLVEKIIGMSHDEFKVTIFDNLAQLPHFSPELSIGESPEIIVNFRQSIAEADGIIICTPEYIFSIPSGLKNALEWCVSTIVFSGRKIGIITASANGIKGHEELKLIMKTLGANFIDETTLLIQGIKGKFDDKGNITDLNTNRDLVHFVSSFKTFLETTQPDTEKQ